MRNVKTIVLLAFLIAALAVVNVLLDRNDGILLKAERFGLADVRSGVRAIRISRKGQPDTQILRKDETWRLVEPYAASADEQSVMRLVDQLSQTPVVDVLSDSALLKLGRTRTDFLLEDANLSLSLESESGETTRYSFGMLTPAKDGVYVAVEGVDAVFITSTNLVAAIGEKADRFRRRSLLPVGIGDVMSFEIKREGSSLLEFIRRDDGWILGEKRAAGQKIATFLADLTAASAETFVWPVGASNESDHVSSSLLAGYGLDTDSAVAVSLNGVGGINARVAFGKEASDGQVYALVQNGDAIVTVPAALRDFATQDALLFTDSRIFPVDGRTVGNFSIVTGEGLYSLARGKDGLWRLESPIDAAADQEAVDEVLARILALSTSDVVSSGGVSVSLATNMPTVSVSRESVLAKLTFEHLRSREILKIDPSLVRRLVALPGGEGAKSVSVVYERTRRVWLVENSESDVRVNVEGVEALLAVLNPLKASCVSKLNVPAAGLAEYGLDKPFLTVAIDQNLDDTVRRNILIGKKTKGGRFATVGSSDAVFVLPTETVNALSQPIVEK